MTGRKLAKVKLCDECRYDGGHHYRDDGTSFRCPNLLNQTPVRSPEAERDRAIAAVGGNDLAGKRQALEIVEAAARAHYEVSANTVRPTFDLEGLDRGLIAGAFSSARARGWVRIVDEQPSRDPGTHAKPIKTYESLIFRGLSSRAPDGAA